jgi:hypothetical protein
MKIIFKIVDGLNFIRHSLINHMMAFVGLVIKLILLIGDLLIGDIGDLGINL